MSMKEEEYSGARLAHVGQTQVWKAMLSHVDSMVLRSAVELRIPDIIHNHGDGHPRPSLTLSRLASLLPSPPSDTTPLLRMMRFLTHNRIFSSHPDPVSREPRFALTPASSALLSSSDRNLLPMVLFQTHPLPLAAWHNFGESVQSGQNPYVMANGMEMLFGTVPTNPEFNKVFNGAMGCTAKGMMEAVLEGYGEGFKGVAGTLVDVGGGPGAMVAEIVRLNPGVKGINFDLPYVVENAPEFPGVTHVAGDMFEFIPRGDVIFMKTVLHCFGDEECLKVLDNCKKVIPKSSGKVVIVDIVLYSEDDSLWGDIRAKFDMVVYSYTTAGKERTEDEWKELLKLAGFSRFNFIKIPAIWSIIEAFPE